MNTTRTSRATFLGLVSMLGVSTTPSLVATADPVAPPKFDQAEFERRVALPYQHRQVYASARLNRAIALHYMHNSLAAYSSEAGFNEGRGTVHVASVMYGASLVTVAGNAEWHDFRIAAVLSQAGETVGEASAGNPWSSAVAELAAAGASFFVCNNALSDLSTLLARAAGGAFTPGMVYARLRAGFIGNALVVPAGVAALNALQEARFTFIQATVN